MAVLLTDLPPGQRIPRDLAGITEAEQGPATPSADYQAMYPYWYSVQCLLGGVEAMRLGLQAFLPKFPKELDADYSFRLNNARLTNVFADILETLSAKPFMEELKIVDGSVGPEFVGDPDPKNDGKRKGGLIDNIDGKGTHLHVFAHDTFYHGIANGLDWVFIDYPKAPGAAMRTVADEKDLKLNPYWYHIPAIHVLDVETDMVGSEEVFTYFRYYEPVSVRAGYVTTKKKRIREITRLKTSADGEPNTYGDPTFTVWEYQEDTPGLTEIDKWQAIDKGTYTIGIIPVVPFLCGKRIGTTWQITPPMRAAVSLQIELYQEETGLKNTKTLVCYPMLAANGVNLTGEDGKMVAVSIGPHTLLNAPPNPAGGSPGNWEFVEPSSESLKFVAGEADKLKQEIRELGRQPLTATSGNITVITSAFAAQRANSAIQAWAIMLKDCLENALQITALWLKSTDEPEVRIGLDFDNGTDDKANDVQALNVMRDRTPPDLSQETYWEEMQRKGILSPEFDADAETKKLAKELPDDADLVAALGPPQPGGVGQPNLQPGGDLNAPPGPQAPQPNPNEPPGNRTTSGSAG